MAMKSFYVGIKGVIIKDNAVLLLKRNAFGKEDGFFWDLPGGRIDEGEGFEQALERELPEELGGVVSLKIGKLLHAHRLEFDVENGNGLMLLFFKVIADIRQITLSDEHIEYKWVTKHKFSDFLQKENEHVSDWIMKAVLEAFSQN